MADLETAAETALAKAVELRELLSRAHAAFASLERQATELSSQLEADWSALEERGRALLDRCGEEEESLSREGEEAVRTLAGLTAEFGEARPEGETSLEAARVSLSGLGARLMGASPEIVSMADQVEETARETAEGAAEVAGALEEALAEARELLEGKLVHDMEAMQEAIEDSAEACCRSITEAESELEERCADWSDALQAVLDLVEQAFDDARQHLADVAEFSLAECRRRHQEFWEDDVAEQLEQLESVLQELGETVEQRTADVKAGDGALSEAVTDADDRLVTLLSALERVKERLATYEFVRM